MKKLEIEKIRKIKAGTASGSFLSGIGDIISAVGKALSSVISTVVGSVYMFVDRGTHHAKADYKIGDSEISYDDSKLVDLEEDKLSHQQDVNDGTIDLSNDKITTNHVDTLSLDHNIDHETHDLYDLY